MVRTEFHLTGIRRRHWITMTLAEKPTGYRNTTQRAVILAEVESAEGHLTAGEIFERVRRSYPSIAYGTVYRTLHLLAEHGLIQELTFADQASRFDKRTDRHDHVHCTVCGVIIDVDVPYALMATHVAEEQSGFQIVNHHTVFTGLCSSCRANSPGVSPTIHRTGD
jgi:Fe2+ or Zn2+ uptake regulation protein